MNKPSREILHDSYSPVIVSVTKDLKDIITSNVYSRVISYCRMDNGYCEASLQRIADDLQISYSTVLRHIKRLCEKKYLIDLTPDVRNEPHKYQNGSRVEVSNQSYHLLPEISDAEIATMME